MALADSESRRVSKSKKQMVSEALSVIQVLKENKFTALSNSSILWGASIVSRMWAAHSNDTWSKFRGKQQCRLLQQKLGITGDWARVSWMTNNSAETSRVCLGSFFHKSKVHIQGYFFPVKWGGRPEVKIPQEILHLPSPMQGLTASSATGLGQVQGWNSKALGWYNWRAEVVPAVSQSIRVICLFRPLCCPSTPAITPAPLNNSVVK